VAPLAKVQHQRRTSIGRSGARCCRASERLRLPRWPPCVALSELRMRTETVSKRDPEALPPKKPPRLGKGDTAMDEVEKLREQKYETTGVESSDAGA
jgi:hypothetical protein